MFKFQTQQTTPTVLTPEENLRIQLSSIHYSLKRLDEADTYHRSCLREISTRVEALKKQRHQLNLELYTLTKPIKVLTPKRQKKLNSAHTLTEEEMLHQLEGMSEEDRLKLISKLIKG
jgi:hypothetical protein